MGQAESISVFLDQNLAKPLEYGIPPDFKGNLEVGMRVEVPLQSRTVQGTIGKILEKSSFPKLRPFLRILSQQGEIPASLWKLADWMASYYATPLSKVLKCFIPPHVKKGTQEKMETLLSLTLSPDEAIQKCAELRHKFPLQAILLETLLPFPKGKLLKEIDISKSALQTLLKKGWISSKKSPSHDAFFENAFFFPSKAKQLNEEQQKALDSIQKALQSNTYETHLIHGITGSGKTEVYSQAMQAALDLGKSAMILVPEVSLTSQLIEKLKARFSEPIAILHHKRSEGEKRSFWKQMSEGKIRLLIGARSALFAPLQNLGLLIVDEEHDSSYKQSDEMPCYQGRDVAVMRGYLENALVLLGSATPSIESRYNAEIGKYQLHTLSQRATTAKLPKIEIVDMERTFAIQKGFTHFSDPLIQALRQRIEKGEQALLFLNRRGYHRLQICKECRYIAQCPHCDLSLTYHKKEALLRCHLCHFSKEPLVLCPECKTNLPLSFQGFGTEHVERSLHALFPDIRTLRMDRDTTTQKTSHETLFKQFRSHKADVLIGTQMIAKGFHFPSVTLVGILNLDTSLSIPDFRAPEQVFQLLTQVAGRAGRSELPGEVILQTLLPNHPLFKLAQNHDYDQFYKTTLEERKAFGFPPFSHLVKCLFSDKEEKKAREDAERARKALLSLLPEESLLPVTPAGHPKVKDLYRFQFIIRVKKIIELKNKLNFLQKNKIKIDVDTISTFF